LAAIELRLQLLAIFAAVVSCAESRPAGISVHTWVREEIFAGYMAGDMTRFEKGMDKVRGILEAEPDNAVALAWNGGGHVLRAVKAREAADMAGYRSLFRTAQAQFCEGFGTGPEDIGVLVVGGGTLIMLGGRLAEADRPGAFDLGFRNYSAAAGLQKQQMDKLPPHFRGELWSGRPSWKPG
jgi:hypothetical protein